MFVTYASSLAHLPLSRLGTVRPAGGWELSADDTRRILGALADRADEAATRLAANTRRALGSHPEPAAVLQHLLTRNRFLKGSRTHLPRPVAIAKIRRFTGSRRPVEILMRGFPFKQYDNGLKAMGSRPDLAEAAALVRFRELYLAFTRIYPPGLRITLLSDGGYHRPRNDDDLFTYRSELGELPKLTEVHDFLRIETQRDVMAAALGDADWRRRDTLIGQLVADIDDRLITERRRHDAEAASLRVADLLAGANAPLFHALFRSLLYSVPVPGEGPVPSEGQVPGEGQVPSDGQVPDEGQVPSDGQVPDDRRPPGERSRVWTATVLDAARDVDVPQPLRRARLVVLDRAWQDTVRSLATHTVDQRLGVWERLPPHIRLYTGGAQPGGFGFTYLGGSTLLPWHGTGFVDHAGRVGVDFAITSLAGGYLPIRSELLARGQPWFLLSPDACDGDPSPDNLVSIMRLKSR